MAVNHAALDVSQSAFSDGTKLEHVPGGDSQRVKLKPQSSLKFYFNGNSPQGAYDADQLYGDASLAPAYATKFGAAGEAGFGTRMSVGSTAGGALLNARAVVMAARNEFTWDMRVKLTGVAGLQALIGVGNPNAPASNLSYLIWANGREILVWLSKGGDTYTSYTTASTPLSAGADHHLRVSYKYVTDGTSELSISVDGVEIDTWTNAVGPLYECTDYIPAIAAWVHQSLPFGLAYGAIGLFDEILFYAEQLPTTFSTPTAPHKPYPTDNPVVTFANSDAGAAGAAWDLSTLEFDGVVTNIEFRAAANETGTGFSYGAWGDLATVQGQADPTGRYFALQARLKSATGSTTPTLCSGRIAVALPSAAPQGQPALEAVTDEGGGDVKGYWTPGDSGTTGKLYARELPAKTWQLIGSAASSPIDGSGLAEGATCEFIVEEFAGEISGVASNALRRTLGAGTVEKKIQQAILSILRADAVLAARVSGDWAPHVLDGARETLDAERSRGRMPYLEVGPVVLGSQQERSGEHVSARASCVVRARALDWSGDSTDFLELLDEVLKALAAEPRLTIPEQVAGFSASYSPPEYRRPVRAADVRLSINLTMDPVSRGEVTA